MLKVFYTSCGNSALLRFYIGGDYLCCKVHVQVRCGVHGCCWPLTFEQQCG